MSFVKFLAAVRPCLLPLAAAAVALVGGSLHAASPKPREATLGGGKASSAPILSKVQLRACMSQQEHVQSQNEATVKTQQQLSTDRAEIDRSAAALKESMATLDRTSEEAVKAYVAKAQAHDKLIDSYEARVPLFNAQVESLQAEREAYAKACEGRRYLEDDLKDIKAGK